MQLVKVITVGGSVRMEFLVVTPSREEEGTILGPIAEEYGLEMDFLYIQNTITLFDGDLSLEIGDLFELVKSSEVELV